MFQISFHQNFKGSDTLLLGGAKDDIETLKTFFQDWKGRSTNLIQHLQPHGKPYLYSIKTLNLRRDKNRNDFTLTNGEAIWTISPSYQDNIVGLLEGLLNNDRPGHQYLDYVGMTGVIQIMVSKDEYALPADKNNNGQCPYSGGDIVRFSPSERTRGYYQDIERFGVMIGQELKIKNIKDGVYLFFEGEVGGWPWNEFTLVRKGNK